MIIYNVTINIDDSVHDQWLNWLKTKHIGEVLDTGCFYKAKLSKVLVDEEMGGTTYSIQYATESKEQLQEYYKTFAPKLREEGLTPIARRSIETAYLRDNEKEELSPTEQGLEIRYSDDVMWTR